MILLALALRLASALHSFNIRFRMCMIYFAKQKSHPSIFFWHSSSCIFSIGWCNVLEPMEMRRQPTEVRAGFHLPTGPTKPPGSGTGIPVRFGRKPVGTGGIQI